MQRASSVPSTYLPRGAWLVVALLCVVGCLNYLDRIMLTTMRSSIIGDIPMTEAQFGLLTAVFLWVYGLLSPMAGFLADRFNRSRIIIIGLFVWSLVTWLTAHATSFPELLATRALMGISEACYLPAALALIADYHRGATRSLATGIHLSGIAVGQSLGFAGAWITERHSWHSAFGVFGAIGIVYSCILLFTLRDRQKIITPVVKAKNDLNFFTVVKDLMSRRGFILLLVFYSLLGVVSWMTIGWLPTYYQEHFNLSLTKSGVYATAYQYPALLIGAILGGWLADHYIKTNPRARILVPVVGLCIAAPCTFLAGSTSILSLTVICFMVFSLTRVFSDVNLMPILCQISDPRHRATGMGLLNACASIVGGLGLYGGGVLRDLHVSLGRVFQAASLIMIVCIVLLYMIKPSVEE